MSYAIYVAVIKVFKCEKHEKDLYLDYGCRTCVGSCIGS